MNKLKTKPKIRMDISIDPDLQAELIEVCQKEERSMSNVISIALKQYIAAYKEREK